MVVRITQQGSLPSMSEAAYRAIEELIVTGVLRPGSMISENQLCADLRLGRSPIREALQRLKLEGYVEIHARRGALVMPFDVLRQIELLEVRRPLELTLTHLAIERATERERSEMRATAAEIVSAAAEGERVRYLNANRAVHEIRIQSAHNGLLAQTMRVIFGLSRRFWFAYIEDTGSFSEAANLHAAILTAMAEGDEKSALKGTRSLLNFLENLTRRTISRRR